MDQGLAALPKLGRMAVIDLVQCPSHEARLAFPELMRKVLADVGGRLVWAGSIDQEVIGRGFDHFQDILVSEMPTGEACVRALAERQGWQPETIATRIGTLAARPWPAGARFAARIGFGALRLLGGGPRPLGSDVADVSLAFDPDDPADPEPDQVEALLAAERDGRVVMANFLRYREKAGPGPFPDGRAPESGRAAYQLYGRNTVPLIGRLGGRIRFQAARVRGLAGDVGEWDEIALVEYPSRAAFIGMLADERYHRGTPLRRAGLEATRLLACTSHAAFH